MSENVIEAVQRECNRVRELVKDYDELGSVGVFGATMLRQDIQEGEAAIASGDVVRILAALKSLQGCE